MNVSNWPQAFKYILIPNYSLTYGPRLKPRQEKGEMEFRIYWFGACRENAQGKQLAEFAGRTINALSRGLICLYFAHNTRSISNP